MEKPLKWGGHPSRHWGFLQLELAWKPGSAEHTGLLWRLGRREQTLLFQSPSRRKPTKCFYAAELFAWAFLEHRSKTIKAFALEPVPDFCDKLYPLPLILNPPGLRYKSDTATQLNIRNDHWVYPVYCLWFTRKMIDWSCRTINQSLHLDQGFEKLAFHFNKQFIYI